MLETIDFTSNWVLDFHFVL